MVLTRLLSALLILLSLAMAPAVGQETKAAVNLDAVKSTIDTIETRLTRGGLTDTELQRLRNDVDPIVVQMNGVVADLVPRIAAVKDRLAQLGPPPNAKDPKANPSEAPSVTEERAGQQKLFDDLDAQAKRAKVLAVQAAQLSDQIVAERRTLFARDLFARSSSLLSPALWQAVASEAPGEAGRLVSLVQYWIQTSLERLLPWQQETLGGLLLLIVVAYYPLWRAAVRVRGRNPAAKPGRLRKALAVVRVTAATASVPVAAVLAVTWFADLFDLPKTLDPIFLPIGIGVAVVAFGTGLGRGLFAPKSPNWRVTPLDDASAKTMYHLVIAVTVVVAAEHVVSTAGDFIGVGVPTAIATRGLGALAVVAVIARSLRKAWVRRHGDQAAALARSPRAEHWAALLRLTGRVVSFAVLAAILIGYVAFASFLIDQVIAIAGTLAMLYVLLMLADDGFSALFDLDTALGRGLGGLIGLKADGLAQVAILLAGIVRVALYVAAVLLVLAPWRIESGDMLATVEAAFFGFSIGGATISLSSVMVAALLFAFALGITKAVQRWLETRYLPRTRLDRGLQNSIKTSFGYVGVLVALGLSLAYLGLSFERLTLIAGGLSLGIGLGLQGVTNNFVSGLILLWERAVRVGDWVEVGSEQGFVRRINVRSTEIETFDRALVIVPNASLVSGQVKNWVRNDRVGRIKLSFTLPVSADPEQIRGALIGTAKAHDRVLAIPVPTVLFADLTDATMTFDLICFVDDVEGRARVTSDLLYDIHGKLKALGYIAPAAAPVVSSPALDKLDAWLTERFARRRRARRRRSRAPCCRCWASCCCCT